MTRNSLGILMENPQWATSVERPPNRLLSEAIVVAEDEVFRRWILDSQDPDVTADFLAVLPQHVSSRAAHADFVVGEGEGNGPDTLSQVVNSDEWAESLRALTPPGRAIPPRDNEGPTQVWKRMLGEPTKYASRIEILDRYLFNNFRNFSAGDSPLEQIFSDCLNDFTGELLIHCARLEEIPFSYERAVIRLKKALQKSGNRSKTKLSLRLCFGNGGGRGREFPHDRWLFFGFSRGSGLMFSLGKGIEDIHGSFEVRSLSEHLAPGDWVKLDAKTKFLEDLSASRKINQMLAGDSDFF